MTDSVTVALIGSASATIVGLFNAYVILKTHNQSKMNGEGIRMNSETINVVKEQTNGIQAKLSETQQKLAHHEGMAAQRKEDKENPS